MLESNITVRCRAADKGVVEGAIAPAIASVKDQVKRDVNIKLDSENFLAPDW